MTTDTTPGTYPSIDIHVEAWGDGTPVVLAHGSVATGAVEWEVQGQRADEDFPLLAPYRRG